MRIELCDRRCIVCAILAFAKLFLQQVTLVAASTLDKDLRGKLKTGADKDAAGQVGKTIAERAIAKGIKEVIFDRGGYRYHGRVKALADAAREGGLSF